MKVSFQENDHHVKRTHSKGINAFHSDRRSGRSRNDDSSFFCPGRPEPAAGGARTAGSGTRRAKKPGDNHGRQSHSAAARVVHFAKDGRPGRGRADRQELRRLCRPDVWVWTSPWSSVMGIWAVWRPEGLVLAIFPLYDRNNRQVILGIGEEMMKRLDALKYRNYRSQKSSRVSDRRCGSI